MNLPELLSALNRLEDRIPTILACKNHGVQLRLSPDGSGTIEAELMPTGSAPEAFRSKAVGNEMYFAYGGFDSIEELEKMLEQPDLIEWSPKI